MYLGISKLGLLPTVPRISQISGALDLYTSGLWSAGGIKVLIGSYVGALIRVRRSSDNAESDINYISTGELDTASLLTFAGAGDAYVVKVYDQSEGGNHFQQLTAAKQARIVSAGVYDGVIRFDGTDDRLDSLNTNPIVPAMTAALRYQLRSFVGTGSASIVTTNNLVVAGHDSWGYQQQSSDVLFTTYIGDDTAFHANGFPRSSAENAELITFDRSAVNFDRTHLYRNGAQVSASTSPGTQATTGNYSAETIGFGGYPGDSQYAPMNLKWFGIWSNSQDANGAAISGAL